MLLFLYAVPHPFVSSPRTEASGLEALDVRAAWRTTAASVRRGRGSEADAVHPGGLSMVGWCLRPGLVVS